VDKNVQLMPGTKMRLVFQRIAPDEFEDARLDYLQETEDDFFAAYAVVGKQPYKISRGDTLWNLCYNKFDIPMWLLERYNSSIDLARLRQNQELIIPIVKGI
jgi:membrane-bound lytic murein transglycosylase D